MFKKILNFLRKIIVLPIRFYQKIISPHIPNACLYNPSCSQYAKNAILKHGFLLGLILGITRIFRCNSSMYVGGDDKVPDKFSFKYIRNAYKEHWRWKKDDEDKKDKEQ